MDALALDKGADPDGAVEKWITENTEEIEKGFTITTRLIKG